MVRAAVVALVMVVPPVDGSGVFLVLLSHEKFFDTRAAFHKYLDHILEQLFTGIVWTRN